MPQYQYRCSLRLVFWTVLLCEATQSACAATFYSYHIGNSLTVDSLPLSAMVHMAAQRGISAAADWHVRSSVGLDYIWTHPSECSLNPTFAGLFPQALSQWTWDAVTLQANGSQLNGPGSDAARIDSFMSYALAMNPASADTQFYIFAKWVDQGAFQPGYLEAWHRPYSGQADSTAITADYYSQLIASVRTIQPQNTRPVLLIPTGHVFAEIDRMIRNEELDGITSITQFYRDYVHLNDLGRFVASTTFYATIFRDNPEGLIPPPVFLPFDPATVAQLQAVIWRVVTTTPFTGVSVPEPALAGPAALAVWAMLLSRKWGMRS